MKNWSFDGLGRLARTLSPYPNPSAAGGLNRTERFYYDGIRRIQEVVTDPVASVDLASASGDPGLIDLGQQTTPPGTDTQGTTLGFETGQMNAAASSGGGGSPPPAPVGQYLDREYVWGPGDGPGGVDELLVQYDSGRNPWWVIQDEGGDVAALCDLGAANQDGRVVAQFTFDAYGSPLSFDSLYTHPLMHCGHKGLFVDRLDVGVVGAGNLESIRIQPGAQLLCHNRNRTYSPLLGRFLQQDPNASGEALLEGTANHGRGIGALVAAFDLQALQGTGANLYEYLGSSPWRHADVTGLSWDPFSMVDDILASRTASAASLMNQICGDMKALAVMTATVRTYLPFPAASIAGEIALAALEGRPLGPVIGAAAIGLLPGGQLLLAAGALATEFADMESSKHGNDIVDEETQEAIQEFLGEGAGGSEGQAQAGLTSQIISTVVTQGLPLAAIFAQSLGGPADTHVYVGKDGDGNIVYVGITNDLPRRAAEHGDRFEGGIHPITSQPVTRLQARAIETAAMTKFGSTGGSTVHAQFAGENTNRSISPKRARFFQAALSWGAQWLAQNASHLY